MLTGRVEARNLALVSVKVAGGGGESPPPRGGVGGAFLILAHHACVRSPWQRTARSRSKLREGANLPALLAAFGAGKGHFVRMISEDDSGTSTTELQIEEDNELPIIQLCGLVEEFRYPLAGLWGRPLLPLWARSSTETIQVRI